MDTLENFPQDRRVEILRSNERLLEMKLKALQLQQELHYGLMQEWCKMDEIALDYDSMRSLMRAYHIAVEGGHEQFKWEGKEFVTAYAKYLLEYGESRLRLDPSQKMTIRHMRATHARIMSNRETKDA